MPSPARGEGTYTNTAPMARACLTVQSSHSGRPRARITNQAARALTAKLKRKPIAQILAVAHDAVDEAALGVRAQQRVDQVDLVHGDELEDFRADLAGGV